MLCGFAWSMLSLVAFRVVQGIGAGAVMPVGRTLIGDVYHGPERARMQGYVSSVFVGAAVIGPMAGAFLAAHTIWPMVFWINVPFGLIAAALLPGSSTSGPSAARTASITWDRRFWRSAPAFSCSRWPRRHGSGRARPSRSLPSRS